MIDPLVARTTDPITSHQALPKKVETLKHHVLQAALILGEFTDSELTQQVEQITGKRQQRGTIARTRLTLERNGLVTRQPGMRNDQITFIVNSIQAMAAA